MPVSLNNVSQVNNAQPIKQQPKTTDEKTKSFPTKTAVVVGTGLTALAAVGIYIATKGKGAKATEKVVQNATRNTQEVAQNTQEATNAIKEMTVDAFKQAGNKFNKGKAVTSAGEAFTGNITHQTKDGKKIVLEYENGALNKSTKYDGENVLSQKEYNYSQDSDLSVVQDGNLILNKIIDTKEGVQRITNSKGFVVKDINTGKIKTLQTEGQGRKDFYYDDKGTLKTVKHNYTAKDGTFMHDTILYSPEGNKKMRIQADGWTEFYDKYGVPTDKINVDILRGNSSLYYHDLQYNKSLDIGGLQRTYSYTTPQGTEGTIFRKNKNVKGKNQVTSNLLLETSDNKSYIVTRNGKDVQIKRSGEKKAIAKDSEEYKNVLAQSNDFMKQFFAKYKTALGLQRQVNEGLKELG